MELRVMMVGIALVNVGACAGVGPLDSPSIAGRYDLVAVNGAVLPCCAQIDSTRTRVTFVGGSLTLADGTQYRIPKCTELHHASYTMVITRRYDDPEGGSHTVADTSSGTYAWSDGEAGQPKLAWLLNSGMVGPFATSQSGVELKVHRQNFGRPPALRP